MFSLEKRVCFVCFPFLSLFLRFGFGFVFFVIEKDGMNAESFPDCRSVLDDVLSGATHSDFPPELLRRTLNANKAYLHNPFAIHEVCVSTHTRRLFTTPHSSHAHMHTPHSQRETTAACGCRQTRRR